jgi:hypothetical protein
LHDTHFSCTFFFLIPSFFFRPAKKAVHAAFAAAGMPLREEGDRVVVQSSNNWHRLATLQHPSQRKRPLGVSALSLPQGSVAVSDGVTAVLSAVAPTFSDAEHAANSTNFWHDTFLIALPLLSETDPDSIASTLNGLDFFSRWCARTLDQVGAHTGVGFYTHALLHWAERRQFLLALPLPRTLMLTPAHFSQVLDESMWRTIRHALLHHTTFNGGHHGPLFSSTASIQLLRRALLRLILRWFLRVPLLRGATYNANADGGDSDDDTTETDNDDDDDDDDGDANNDNHNSFTLPIASPPATIDALCALLARLLDFYCTGNERQQFDTCIASLSRQPLFSQAAISAAVATARAQHAHFQQHATPSAADVLQSLSTHLPPAKLSRLDAEREHYLERVQNQLNKM